MERGTLPVPTSPSHCSAMGPSLSPCGQRGVLLAAINDGAMAAQAGEDADGQGAFAADAVIEIG